MPAPAAEAGAVGGEVGGGGSRVYSPAGAPLPHRKIPALPRAQWQSSSARATPFLSQRTFLPPFAVDSQHCVGKKRATRVGGGDQGRHGGHVGRGEGGANAGGWRGGGGVGERGRAGGRWCGRVEGGGKERTRFWLALAHFKGSPKHRG